MLTEKGRGTERSEVSVTDNMIKVMTAMALTAADKWKKCGLVTWLAGIN